MNPVFVELFSFHRTKWLTHRPQNIQVNAPKTVKYCNKSLRILGPHIWNSLPKHIKVYEIKHIKKHIKPSVWTNLQMQLMRLTDLIRSLETVLKYFYLHIYIYAMPTDMLCHYAHDMPTIPTMPTICYAHCSSSSLSTLVLQDLHLI